MRAAARHDADVASGDAVEFLVAAPYLGKYCLRLAGRSDVIAIGDDRQQIGSQPAQVHPLAANHQFALHQAIVAVQVHDELAKRSAGQRNVVRDPGVHGVPGLDDLRIVQVVPQLQVVADVVLHRLQRLCAVVDHLAGHVAEGRQNLVDIEVLLVGPARKGESAACWRNPTAR